MEPTRVELDQDLVELLDELQRPPEQAARELIVLGLYAQDRLSGGRAAEFLGLTREGFIRLASERGIPYFRLSGDELRAEIDASKDLQDVSVGGRVGDAEKILKQPITTEPRACRPSQASADD